MQLPEFQWLSTVPGNLQNRLRGRSHQASGKHLPRTLAEFCYRCNRRFDLASMRPSLGWAAVRTPPMPHRLLVPAEA
ncbi:MAG: hypothetical protein GVY28_14290 [Alphaproteobacteria bacterium]|jgi:hypothetical protein|nr:hypothetical protein [Alphaproteobacteria bacterium]